RQQAPGGPDVAEKAPLRRRDAQQLCVVVGVRELLQVGERADPVVQATNAQGAGLGVVARHGCAPGRTRIPADRDAQAEEGSETATRSSDVARETAAAQAMLRHRAEGRIDPATAREPRVDRASVPAS